MDVLFFLSMVFFLGIVVVMYMSNALGEKMRNDTDTEYRINKQKRVKVFIYIACVIVILWFIRNVLLS